jgi:hypothetical protein
MNILKRWIFIFLVAVGASSLALMAVFPGPRSMLAFTLLTGIGRDQLQTIINDLENDAIQNKEPTMYQREFLKHFYLTLAEGGKLSGFARQSGELMSHYLNRSGFDFKLNSSIFTNNSNVMLQAHLIKGEISVAQCTNSQVFKSEVFYMPHSSSPDSIFGLYYGTLQARTHREGSDCEIHWKAEVPWIWPSYADIKKKTGTPHGESFPLPSFRSVLLGINHSLYVDNGLGRYIEDHGLAKRFIAYGEWIENSSLAALPQPRI